MLVIPPVTSSQEDEYYSLRTSYDKCAPSSYGGITPENTIGIRFLFLADEDQCSDSESPSVNHLVKNLHPSLGLVFRWEKAFLSNGADYPLAPNSVTSDFWEVAGAVLDKQAPIEYTPSLRHTQRASAYVLPGDSSPSTTSRITSRLFSTVLNKIKDRLDIIFEVTSSFIDQELKYDISIAPPTLRFGIGGLPSMAPQTQEAFQAALKNSEGTVERVALWEQLSDQTLRNLPAVLAKESLWLVSPGEKTNEKGTINVIMKTNEAYAAVVPVVLFDKEGVPIITGAVSIYVPKD
jgi:hypothetical protein